MNYDTIETYHASLIAIENREENLLAQVLKENEEKPALKAFVKSFPYRNDLENLGCYQDFCYTLMREDVFSITPYISSTNFVFDLSNYEIIKNWLASNEFCLVSEKEKVRYYCDDTEEIKEVTRIYSFRGIKLEVKISKEIEIEDGEILDFSCVIRKIYKK